MRASIGHSVSLKVEYDTPTKVTHDVKSLLFGRNQDNYSTSGASSFLAVDLEASGWRGNCAGQLTVDWIKEEKIELREDLKSCRGLAVSLEIICHNCGESTSTMSSKISNKCYDVNLRLTYGMRAIGKGGAAARIFCGFMN
ncbi:hypothetical protein TNCV_3141281 [Trichonephila clavipes]|nr:hypothetical protein TNCV_3141281 [Trichonephila clavipes]